MVRKEDLLKTLEDLRDEEFEDFKCLLKEERLAGYQTIKASQLQNAERRNTVDLMVQTYQLPGAVEATKKLLKMINRNDLLQSLSDISSGPEDNISDDKESSENRGPSPFQPLTDNSQSEDDSTILDKLAVLHVDDAYGEVDVEEVSEVTQHHVKLSEPTFSRRMVLVKLGFPVKIKCNVLIYYKLNPSSLNLHVYLIPHDPGLLKTVHEREDKDGYKEIRKPHPDSDLRMEERFILTADKVTATITPPEGLKLRYQSKGPNFYEVYIKNPDRDFNLTLKKEEPEPEPVWTCGIRKDDYQNSDEAAAVSAGPCYSATGRVDVCADLEASENRGPSSCQTHPLLEVSTISSHSEGTSRSSESGSIKGSSDWTTLEPEVNCPDADEAPTYSLQSEAGRFECRVSRLRWVCKEKVSFKYQFGTLPENLERTEHLGYTPAGPILDIKVISGKLNEVYLPHWVCTDDSTILDKFAVLHIDDACGEVDVEEVSEVTQRHVKLSEPTFSLKMTVVKCGFPLKIDCNVLIYYKLNPSSLNLHVYLIPNDSDLQQIVDKRENNDGYKKIRKPRPDRSLKMKKRFILTADMDTATITPPEGLKLRYQSKDPNFYEVYIKNPEADFNLTLKKEEPESEPVWTCGIRKNDYPNSGGTEMPNAAGSSGAEESQIQRPAAAGNTTSTAQNGSVANQPQMKDVRVKGNMETHIHYHGQPPARDETG